MKESGGFLSSFRPCWLQSPVHNHTKSLFNSYSDWLKSLCQLKTSFEFVNLTFFSPPKLLKWRKEIDVLCESCLVSSQSPWWITLSGKWPLQFIPLSHLMQLFSILLEWKYYIDNYWALSSRRSINLGKKWSTLMWKLIFFFFFLITL